jgi:hypothetical protein
MTEPQVSEAGDDVIVPLGFSFPPLCVKCGATRRLHSMPWTLEASPRFASVMPLARFLVSQRTTVRIACCDACYRKWMLGAYLPMLALPISLVGVLFIVFGANHGGPWPVRGLLLLVLASLYARLSRYTVRTRMIHARSIDAERVRVIGVGPEARAAMIAAAKRTTAPTE